MRLEVLPGKQPGSSRVQLDGLALEVVGRRAGKLDLIVTDRDGAIAFRDYVDPASSSARAAFAEACGAKLNGRADAAAIDRMLLASGEHQRTTQRPQRRQDAAVSAGPGQAKRLVLLVKPEVVFRAPDGESVFAAVTVDQHREVWPIRSKGFRRWLSNRFWSLEENSPSAQAVADALTSIEGRTQFTGKVSPVFIRVAPHGTDIYLDLANQAWEAVRITGAGWEVVSEPPVYFRRTRGMQALPTPAPGGSVHELRQFINIANLDWPLILGWFVSALHPTGPYPALVLHGDHGAAKSTAARVMRRLTDPNSADLRGATRDLRDLALVANNGWIVALDNLSAIPEWLSDGICRLATGAGFSTRELYSDLEETIIDFQRPVILNGIEEIVTRPDLLDRALIVYLPRIDDTQRRTEKEFWAAFEAARPRLLGTLLDLVSTSLRNAPNIRLRQLPRMADFAVRAVAAEPAFRLEPGAFMAAYLGKTAAAHELALEASVIAVPINTLVELRAWEGNATELLDAITPLAPEATRKTREWPKNSKSLANALRRIASNLRATGVEVTFHERAGHEKRRLISIVKVGDLQAAQPARAAQAPEQAELRVERGHDAAHAALADRPPPTLQGAAEVPPAWVTEDDQGDGEGAAP